MEDTAEARLRSRVTPSPDGPPLPREALEAALAPSLPAARTLPPAAYTSEDVLAWELERFFARSWVCVGRGEDVADSGDQRAVGVADEGVLLVRGKDGRLRGFFNVCRHRGHELLPSGERRSARVIKCPYHAWVYGLDGGLAAAPRFADVPGFRKEEFPLMEANVEEWYGWVFVNPSGEAPGLLDHVGNLHELVVAWGPDRLRVAARRRYTVGANWKVIHENYHECYHCSSIHPELCRVTPPESGEHVPPTGAWIGGSMELRDEAETMSLDGRSRGLRLPGLPEEEARKIYYYGLFPNLLISLHPDYVLTHRLDPASASETVVECEWLFSVDSGEPERFDPSYAVEFWDVTNRQDWRAVESVQRGLASRGARQGPFTWTEDETHLFDAMVARAYLDGRVIPPGRG